METFPASFCLPVSLPLHVCLVKLEGCLFLSVYTFCADSSSFCAFPYFTLSFVNPGRPRCCSLPQQNVGHLFSATPFTPTRRWRWKEVITSLSVSPPSFSSSSSLLCLFHPLSTLNETLQGLPELHLCPLFNPQRGSQHTPIAD